MTPGFDFTPFVFFSFFMGIFWLIVPAIVFYFIFKAAIRNGIVEALDIMKRRGGISLSMPDEERRREQ